MRVLLSLRSKAMKKVNMSPELVNMTKGMSVPATEGKAYSIRPEGKVEYPRGKATGDMAVNTRDLKPKLTPGLKA